MPVSRRIAVLVFPLAVAGIALGAAHAPADPAGDHVRRHLDSVLVELRTADVAPWSAAQRARRGALVAELAAYRNRGSFPHNYDYPGQLVPYFRDRITGALCAVGDLLAYTGRQDIVDRVAATDDNVRVAQLAGDSAFRRWLDDNGLTLAEAARIQVVYARPVSNAQIAGTIAVAVVAPIAALASFGVSWVNLTHNTDGHLPTATALGFAAGGLTVASGIALLHSPMPLAEPGRIATAIGLGGVALSTYAAVRHHDIVARERDAAARSSGVSVSIAPTVDVPAAGARPNVGAAMSIVF